MFFYGTIAKYLTITGILVSVIGLGLTFVYSHVSKLKSVECELLIQDALNEEREKFKNIMETQQNLIDLDDNELNEWMLGEGYIREEDNTLLNN